MKKSLYLTMLFVSFLMSTGGVFAQVNPAQFTFAGTHGGKNYYISNFSDTWDNAHNICIANGGYLAIPSNAAENAFLAGLYAPYGVGWIGLNDMATEGVFASSNCTPVTYTNWAAGEPNDCGGCCGSPALGEDHVELYTSGLWNDICYGYSRFFVLELHDVTTWNGGSTNWFAAANWSNGVPDGTKTVIVPATANNPVINANTAFRTLEVQAGAAVSVTAGTLQLTGQNINVAGTFDMTGGTFLFEPGACNPSAQNIAGSGTVVLNNVTVNNAFGVTASGNFGVRRLLLLQNGNLTSNGRLTLLSDASSTGMVVHNAFNVIGDVTVQRLVLPYGPRPTGLGYTYFSNPTTGGTLGSAFSDDMGIISNPAYKFNCWLYPAPLSSAPFPNVYTYDESLVNTGTDPACNNESRDKFETAWVSANAGTAFQPGKGFCINIGGNTLADVTGNLNNGNINIPVTKSNPSASNSGWNLVGNPYAAPVDWDLLHALNGGLLDPQMMRRVATGTYTGTWAYYVAGVPGSGTNGADDEIASMQGFFVRANASGNMQFNNSVRLTTYDNTNFFRNEKPFSVLRIKVENNGKHDETSLFFGENGHLHGNALKAQFNSAPFPNVFMTDGGANFAVKGFERADEQTLVPFTIFAGETGRHKVSISHFDGLQKVSVFIENEKTGEVHNLKAAPFFVEMKKGERLLNMRLRFSENSSTTSDNLLMLFPNPAHEQITLVFNQFEKGEYSVTDLSGRVVKSGAVEGLNATCDVRELPKGLYILRFKGEAGEQSLKFVKE